MRAGSFDLLTPEAVIAAVEQAYGLRLDGTVTPYPSYINRVYGLRTDEGRALVTKFYRPGRWSWDGVLDEHEFLLDCAELEIPVVTPLRDLEDDTLCEVTVGTEDIEESFFYALYSQMGGRNFDAESDDDWYRLGTIIGRCHVAGAKKKAEHRETIHPSTSTRGFLLEISENDLVPPSCRDDWNEVSSSTIEMIEPLFEGVQYQRVHGDCHRGNILDRLEEGLLLYDFDDMANGPPVQDLWLLLPDYAENCKRELTMLLDGYNQFSELQTGALDLIEPLRFMRMVYFLVWRARQSHDYWFRSNFPDWGTEAFWIKEIEDLRVQRDVIAKSLGTTSEINTWS